MRFKFVSSGQSVDDAAVITQVIRGESLKTLAPVNLRGSRNSAGDLLIEWTRRERIAAGLRDNAGTALSEEQEVYVIEIYSGSTLKRSIRDPNVRISEITPWAEIYDPEDALTIGANGALTWSGIANTGVVESSKAFVGDFVIEFTVGSTNSGPSWIGVVPFVHNSPTTIANWHDPYTVAGYPVFFCASGEAWPQNKATHKTTGLSSGDKLSIHRTGAVVRFYRNYSLSSVAVPLLQTSFSNTAEGLRVFAEFTVSDNGSLSGASAEYGHKTAYNYTANQQVDDGFTPNVSPIKVRVAQESAIVGKGAHIEANL